ncbi:hypothetical protein J5Y04_28510 [Kitasatospora sp. RG8]|uniref:hypothetical protein n=1 Tax=Kitasatospora sp. RG8 TaxID=2820815 RepID=UPI001ADF6D64|nr:hypothetical protein [Kitasatospora sp. RG8]MBP0453458.1 hypothetical protein [Kitasatospora sp. RG8]
MPIKAVTCHVAVCDVCGTEYGSATDDECVVHSTTREAAVAVVYADPDWLVTPDGRVICLDIDDPAHQSALEEMLPPPPPAICDDQITLPIDL